MWVCACVPTCQWMFEAIVCILSHVGENGPDFLMLLPSPSECWDPRCGSPHSGGSTVHIPTCRWGYWGPRILSNLLWPRAVIGMHSVPVQLGKYSTIKSYHQPIKWAFQKNVKDRDSIWILEVCCHNPELTTLLHYPGRTEAKDLGYTSVWPVEYTQKNGCDMLETPARGEVEMASPVAHWPASQAEQ